MKRVTLRILLAIGALLMFFRFGGPALFFGATGPGPFGNRWLTDAKTANLLLDADLRFFGAMMIGIGVILVWVILRHRALASVVYILACAIALGAAARIYARITYGDPGTAGTVPIVYRNHSPGSDRCPPILRRERIQRVTEMTKRRDAGHKTR